MPFRKIRADFLDQLIKNNLSFTESVDKDKLKHLFDVGQSPRAVIITCSDSRIVPEYIFDADVGEFFTIRTAGNIISQDKVASIEFAVNNLKVKNIIVLGHNNCGAINASVDHYYKDKDLEHWDNFDPIFREIKPSIIACKKESCGHDVYDTVSEKNVLHTKKRILEYSNDILQAYIKKEIHFFCMMYDLSSGSVREIENGKYAELRDVIRLKRIYNIMKKRSFLR